MCKKMIAASLLSVFLLTISPMQQAWAANTVQVTLPGFTVTLNGQSTGNEYSKYPLIVYKDITYFPMTYYDCRLLGLKTDWTEETGLVIDKNEDYFYEYLREVNNSKNAKKQTAKIADEKITVNGKVIDNSKEEYPLLVFRDITYFPLTWRFAVNEFGWNYHFDQKDGLVIKNDKVKLENPEEWTYVDEDYGGGMGERLPIMLNGIPDHQVFSKRNDKDGWLGHPNVGFCNTTGHDLYMEIFPAIKFCIYRNIGAQEELTYWRLTPSYQGKLSASHYTDYEWNMKYWLNAPNGNYTVKLITAPHCIYRDLISEERVQGELHYRYDISSGNISLTS